jgi:hypothetical protein
MLFSGTPTTPENFIAANARIAESGTDDAFENQQNNPFFSNYADN